VIGVFCVFLFFFKNSLRTCVYNFVFFLSLNILWGGAYSIFEVLSRDLCDREGNDEINIHYYWYSNGCLLIRLTVHCLLFMGLMKESPYGYA
jgi:hypothetical protein